ncbi:MAG: hypothetical protein V3V09_05835 [Arenicellales bacterium]
MNALLKYVQKVVASKRDGAIYIRAEPGKVATLILKNRAISAATFEALTGKPALNAIKQATIIHMEFWPGVTLKSDLINRIQSQKEAMLLSPASKHALNPQGAEFPSESLYLYDDTDLLNDLDDDSSLPEESTPGISDVSEKNLSALTKVLRKSIGPAASVVMDEALSQAQNIDHLIELLTEELFDEKDVNEFTQSAYFLLGLD